MLRRLPVLALVLAALAAPSAAQAGTAKVETYQACVDVLACKAFVYETRQTVGFDAAAGEANAVTLSRSGDVVTVRDTGAAVTPGSGCTRGSSDNEAACAVSATFYSAGATLGDGHDSLTVAGPLAVPVSGNGGAGNDRLTGGDEANNLDGGPGLDILLGGGGADKLSGGDDRDADTLEGGSGRDLVDYSARTAPVSVNLALGTRVQGEAGENERVLAVEDVNGGTGADVLRGGAGANRISGGAGGDILAGAGGPDVLTGDAGVDSFDGGSGTDALRTKDFDPGAERVSCGSGSDTVGQSEPGGLYLEERDFFGPDSSDVLAADCERALLPSESLSTRLVFDPRLRKLSPVALAISNPCGGRRGCSGRVRVIVPGVRKAVGQARFNRRGRLVPVGISVVGERAVRRRKILAVGLRVATSGADKDTYASSYRTRAAR